MKKTFMPKLRFTILLKIIRFID